MHRPFARRVAIASTCLLVAGVILAHEGHAPLPSKGATVDQAAGLIRLSADARSALDVQTAEISPAPPPETVLAYATLQVPWKGHGFAVSPLPGRIAALHAKPGDRVEAGQMLAELSSQEVETLRLEIQSARTEARLAEQLVRGLKESAGAVAGSNLIDAETRLLQATDALDLAGVKWIALGLPRPALDPLKAGTDAPTPTLPIRSPVAGTVVHADLAVGKVVEPGEHLFEVTDLSLVWARIGVLEKDLGRVAAGRPVEVRLTAYPGESFRGTVAVVGDSLDPLTHLNDVWAEFRNPAGAEPRLLPGMSGQARIELPPAANTKSVPSAALVDDGVDRFVLVEEASATGVSEYRKKSVELVRETPGAAEIRSPDLFPGDRVVTRGGHELGGFFVPGVLRLSPESARTIGLRVEPASLRVVEEVVEVPGAVDLPPGRRSVAAARMPGTITSIGADRGQTLKAGDVVAEVFSLELLNLQLDLLRDQLAADLAGRQLARLKAAGESVPKRRLVETEAASASAANRRDALRRRLELVGLSAGQLDALIARREAAPTLPVRAAVAGTVVAFNRSIGQSVRADEALFEVHDLSQPWIEAFVSEGELARVRVGQPARVRLVGEPGVVLDGKVTRSGRTFGAGDRTLSVWVELDAGRPARLRKGQMARLALTAGSRPATLAVPLDAVVRDGTRAFVFVRAGDTFERRAVELGRTDDRFAEVASGLVAGEPVAVGGAEALNTAWASVR